PADNLEKPGYMSRSCAPDSTHNTITSRCVVAFLFADFADRHGTFCRAQKQVCQTPAKFARGPVVVRGRILNVCERDLGDKDGKHEGNEILHGYQKSTNDFRPTKSILRFLVF